MSTFTEPKRGRTRAAAGGSSFAALAGAAAMALAIIGLARVYPMGFLSAATIVAGGALLVEAAAIGTRFTELLSRSTEPAVSDIGGGFSAELFGGAAGIALGIVAASGAASLVLDSIAAIVYGAALLVSSSTAPRINALLSQQTVSTASTFTRELLPVASGAKVIGGLGAIALGILGVIGVGGHAGVVVLSLVAMLATGTAVLFSGGAIGSRFVNAIRP